MDIYSASNTDVNHFLDSTAGDIEPILYIPYLGIVYERFATLAGNRYQKSQIKYRPRCGHCGRFIRDGDAAFEAHYDICPVGGILTANGMRHKKRK